MSCGTNEHVKYAKITYEAFVFVQPEPSRLLFREKIKLEVLPQDSIGQGLALELEIKAELELFFSQ